jgi:D-alanyl-D-alanine dipeptidase
MDEETSRINDRKVTEVEVRENGESLVNLRDYLDFLTPSEVRGIENPETWTDPEFTMVRKSVAERLLKADEILQQLRPGTKFVITETLRSYGIQKKLYERRLEDVKNERPDLNITRLEALAAESVSNPDIFSPHTTGGPIDLTLADVSGLRLDMGIKPGYGPWDRSDYQNLTKEQKENRELLAKVMQGAGFVNYPMEWWHWSFGDKYWGFVTGNPAIYGPAINI